MVSLFLLLFSTFNHAVLVDGIYATVDDEMIAHSDISNYKKQLQGKLLYEDLLFADKGSIEESLNNKDQLIKKMIDEKILDSEAKKLGVNITNDRINKEVSQKGGPGQLAGLLRQKGLTLGDYKKFLKKSLARREVVTYYVTSKIKISDDDVMDYYVSKTGGQAGQGFEFSLSHILFETGSGKTAAQKKAQLALAALQSSSFAKVQQKYNPGQDADFGKFKSGEMLPMIERAILPLKAGETSTIVQSPLGFHIFKLNGKKVVDNPDFNRVKKRIFQVLYAKNFKEQLDYWLHQRRKLAVIKINGSKQKI